MVVEANPPRYCQCGCGTRVKKDFAKGHYARVWNPSRPDYHLRPPATSKLKLNRCKCGCGTPVRDNYVRGHGRNRVGELEVRRKISASLKAYFEANPPPAPHMRECGCGCGTMIKASKRFVHGHNVRVDHCSKWPEVRRKRSDNTARMWETGILHAGMMTPEVRRESARKCSEALKRRLREDAEFRLLHEKKLEKARAKSTGIFQKGSAHVHWKGGVTPLSNLLHGSYELAKVWKQPILRRDKYTCQKCGTKTRKGLQVHHDDVRMSEIVRMFVPEKNRRTFTEAEIQAIHC